MLDELLRIALAEIEKTEADIAKWRDATDMMTDDEDVGDIRKRQLSSPLKSSTPIDKQISSFEQTYWSLETVNGGPILGQGGGVKPGQ